eukprot:4575812-Pleurochrysis_carterae.AAC.2
MYDRNQLSVLASIPFHRCTSLCLPPPLRYLRYLLNFSISVVCGVLILWGAMWAYKKLVDHFECHIMRSGEYGKPPKLTAWVMQARRHALFFRRSGYAPSAGRCPPNSSP